MLDLNLINKRIKKYLTFYHHDRVHKSLNDQTPSSIVGYNLQQKSKMYVTYTQKLTEMFSNAKMIVRQ